MQDVKRRSGLKGRSAVRLILRVEGLDVQLYRKDIKHMHLAVKPPRGTVNLSIPRSVSDEEARSVIVHKLEWIRTQQAKLANREGRSDRAIETGASHFFWGRRYRLTVAETSGKEGVRVHDQSTIELRVGPERDRAGRAEIMAAWYRRSLEDYISAYLPKWEKRMGVSSSKILIRKMKTKWGSCNIKSRRINLNLELASKPESCLEFVIVHELCHLLEAGHGKRFNKLMDGFLPGWREQKAILDATVLAETE
jgi:predicted metal-dependent hydrolase